MRKLKSIRARFLVMLAFVAICAIGFFTRGGIGNVCAVGWDTITLACPLGAILSMIAQRTAIPQALISVIVVLAICLLLGRVFCSWLCPVHFMTNPKGRKQRQRPIDRAPVLKRARILRFDTRYAILLAAIGSTLILGFPVFCLMCPIGITFALVLLVMRLFVFGETTWTIILFLGVLIAEVVLLPHWCNRLCPLGALYSLFSAGNKTLLPTVDESSCLETAKGIKCGACQRACHVDINLHDTTKSHATLSECTKCRACAEVCPASAITFPFLPKKKEASQGAASNSGKPIFTEQESPSTILSGTKEGE